MYANNPNETNQEMLADFLEENLEWMAEVQTQLIHIESGESFDRNITVNLLFRQLHTLKGTAPFFGLIQVQSLSHALENILDKIRANELEFSEQVVSTLLLGINLLFDICEQCSEVDQEVCDSGQLESVLEQLGQLSVRKADTNVEIFEFIKVLEPLLNLAVIDGRMEVLNLAQYSALSECSEALFAITQDPVNHLLHLSKVMSDFELAAPKDFIEESGFSGINCALQNLLYPSGADSLNVISTKTFEEIKALDNNSQPLANEIADNVGETVDDCSDDVEINKATKHSSFLKVRRTEMDALIDLVAGLSCTVNQMLIDEADDPRIPIGTASGESISSSKKLSSSFMGLRKQLDVLLCAPLENLTKKVPGMVHTICSNLNKIGVVKKVKVVTECGDVSVSEGVYRLLEGPVIHIIRNAVDHGIEPVQKRLAVNKPEVGQIRVTAGQEGEQVRLVIQDDGAGICIDAVKQKAMANGLITEYDAQHMQDHSVIELLFTPGFSTAEQVTDISGRGVGLDVVKSDITEAGGSLEIQNEPNQGTTFIIKVAATEALFTDCITAQINGHSILIPLDTVKTICSVKGVSFNDSRSNLVWRGETVRCSSFPDLFLAEGLVESRASEWIIMTESHLGLLAILVDEVGCEFCVTNKQIVKDKQRYGIEGTVTLGEASYFLLNPCLLKSSLDVLFI
ncbi:MAG: hypothetical protein COB04_10265 [Gammaproteobacteria bacterium]|nr:MAG: hypothetical protein COB04_10265 [Gammaproteobacteria bacterium]